MRRNYANLSKIRLLPVLFSKFSEPMSWLRFGHSIQKEFLIE